MHARPVQTDRQMDEHRGNSAKIRSTNASRVKMLSGSESEAPDHLIRGSAPRPRCRLIPQTRCRFALHADHVRPQTSDPGSTSALSGAHQDFTFCQETS